MFFRLGLFAHRYRWLVVAAWTAIATAGFTFGPALTRELTAGGWDDPQSESSRAIDTLRSDLGFPRGIVTFVFEDEPERLRSAELRERFARMARRAKDVEGVVAVIPADGSVSVPHLSADGRAFRLTVEMNADPDAITDRIPRFREIAREAGARRSSVTGTAAIYYDYQQQSEEDLRDAEVVTFPLALAALLFFFGSVASALLPLVVAAAAVAVTTGLVFVIAQQATVSVYVVNTMTMLGLAMAIDYCLLVVNRFREELRTLPVAYAVARANATAGRAVAFSGFTVFVGLSGLLFFGFPGIGSVGIGGSVVVAVAVLASITLLPAALSILGKRVDFGRIALLPTRGGTWHRIATAVMRRPFLFIVAVVAIVGALAWPATHLKVGFPSADELPEDVESRVGLAILDERFGQREGDELVIAVQGANFRTRDGLVKLQAFTSSLRADRRVLRVMSAVDLVSGLTLDQYAAIYGKELDPETAAVVHGSALLAQARERWVSETTAAVLVTPESGALTQPTRDLVRDVRAGRVGERGALDLRVGGLTAAEFDFNDRIFATFPYVVAGIVTVTLVVLFLLLNSVVLPVKAVIMNGASVLAAYGILTLIFQDGFLAGPLGADQVEYVSTTLPIFLFCVLFGVSMDYEVFLLSRMREFWDETRDNVAAVANGLERTGRVVTSAALVFVIVVSSFARADIQTIKALGIALASAIFLDATIIRALLVPATMRVLGRWNWWSPIQRAGGGIEH